MNTLLGSEFETYLRILILFEAAFEEPLNEETIAMLDFMTIYSRDFEITDSNLHGESSYRFAEFTSRRELVKSAIKRLVLDGLINVLQTKNGFEYTLSRDGLEFASHLNSKYADTYYETAMQVLVRTRGMTQRALSELINKRITASLQGG
ncbi:ABC-three component system middle component 2 [Desulfolucanica intricata]|uniref:ABC-three component system middle component 2 n=1 Tax=Desulfolucanica intricata TaxID=1285191 RepID=UPI00083348F1|nr:ABC-three component system middle component 2 [Desulfolucanica intricata]